jgi:hypothetical protein
MMDLTQHNREASVSYHGATTVVMPAEARLRFQNTDGQGNFLDEVVPEGKEWSVRIDVNVVETDAA